MTNILKDVLDHADLISRFVGKYKSILFFQFTTEDKVSVKNSQSMMQLNSKPIQKKKKK